MSSKFWRSSESNLSPRDPGAEPGSRAGTRRGWRTRAREKEQRQRRHAEYRTPGRAHADNQGHAPRGGCWSPVSDRSRSRSSRPGRPLGDQRHQPYGKRCEACGHQQTASQRICDLPTIPERQGLSSPMHTGALVGPRHDPLGERPALDPRARRPERVQTRRPSADGSGRWSDRSGTKARTRGSRGRCAEGRRRAIYLGRRGAHGNVARQWPGTDRGGARRFPAPAF